MKSNEDKLKELDLMEFFIDSHESTWESGINGILNELLTLNKSNWGKTITISLWKDYRTSDE
jgi:hypothetical protein